MEEEEEGKMLSFVKSVTVRFHPFNAHNGTARQFLAQCGSPSWGKRFSEVQIKWEVEEKDMEPIVEIVYGV